MLKSILLAVSQLFTARPSQWEVVQTVEVDSFGAMQFCWIRKNVKPGHRWRMIKGKPEGSISFCACETWVLERRKEQP